VEILGINLAPKTSRFFSLYLRKTRPLPWQFWVLASINEIDIAIVEGLRSSRPISHSGSLKEEIQQHAPTPVTFNLTAIGDRVNVLQSNHLSTAYSNEQKQSSKIQFEIFLFVLPDV